jgi:ABC-type sugar transport system ATPase subunit
VLIISDELDELAIADRVLVMFEGQIRAEFPRGWAPGDLIAAMEGVGLDPIEPAQNREGH